MAKKTPPPRKRSALAKKFGERFTKLLGSRRIEHITRPGGGLKYNTVESWLFGHRFPRPRGIVDLAIALNVSPDELLDGLDVPPKVREEVVAIVINSKE